MIISIQQRRDRFLRDNSWNWKCAVRFRETSRNESVFTARHKFTRIHSAFSSLSKRRDAARPAGGVSAVPRYFKSCRSLVIAPVFQRPEAKRRAKCRRRQTRPSCLELSRSPGRTEANRETRKRRTRKYRACSQPLVTQRPAPDDSMSFPEFFTLDIRLSSLRDLRRFPFTLDFHVLTYTLQTS